MALERSGTLRKKTPAAQELHGDEVEEIVTLRYEETLPAKPPIPVTVALPRAPPTEPHPALRSRPATPIEDEDPTKREFGLALAETPGTRESWLNGVDEHRPVTLATNGATSTQKSVPLDNPNLNKSENSISPSRWKSVVRRTNVPKTPVSDEEFSPITTPIPSNNRLELDFMDDITFSKRGSVLLGGEKALDGQTREMSVRSTRLASHSINSTSSAKILSEETEKESQKVRSLYDSGVALEWVNGKSVGHDPVDEDIGVDETERSLNLNHESQTARLATHHIERPESLLSAFRREYEMAGGIEDWENIEGGDVDRYGFIKARQESARTGSPEPRAPQRVSTVSLSGYCNSTPFQFSRKTQCVSALTLHRFSTWPRKHLADVVVWVGLCRLLAPLNLFHIDLPVANSLPGLSIPNPPVHRRKVQMVHFEMLQIDFQATKIDD
jgi:hypothetical protein